MTDYSYLYGQRRPLPDDGSYEPYFDMARTAFVSIDMHDGHLSESPECPCPAPRARAIVERVDDVHRRGRDLGARVIHVRTGLRPSGIDDINGIPSAWRLPFSEFVGGIPNIDQHGIEGSPWTRLVTEVLPQDEVVTTKKRVSAFYPTDLDFLLRQMDVRNVVLTGCMTDCCILSSAFDASNRNYRVIVVRDCVAGTNDELEDAALKIISLNLGLVMDAADLIESWAVRQSGDDSIEITSTALTTA
ncbi:isochorismatase family cysteine hydrolase [Nocardioides aquiterrae]|uniref:Isochorismatase-like domain-containing protein n=1 Tax=Nocardioides aquiterrae TaxID=203799 RepID=A0ABP4F1U3_9ACTN